MGKFSFRKDEKLKKEKHIQELFDKGSSFYLFPFKVFYLKNSDTPSNFNQVLISVSKRNFKKAVDRNLIKRRIREAYRLQKEMLSGSYKLHLGFVYTHKEILMFQEIKNKLAQTILRINKQL